MDAGPNEVRLEQQLRELEDARAADRAAERRSARANWAIAGSLLAIAAGFAVVNYRHFQAEWTQPKLEASLRRELDSFGLSATSELEALVRELGPVYADESARQLRELSPEIAQRFATQFEHLGTDLHAETLARLTDTEASVRTRVEELVCANFPELAAANHDALTARIHRATDDAVALSIAHFDERFAKDVTELQDVVMSFDVSDTEETTVELQKRFLRCWLRLLDGEIEKL